MRPKSSFVRSNNNNNNEAPKSSLLDRLQRLSLEEKAATAAAATEAAKATRLTSQYQLNYTPMPVGLRKDLWEEGWKYRNIRRRDGFNHFKLEWMILTDRGRRGSAAAAAAAARKRSEEQNGDDRHHPAWEPLNLPPTKLEKKRLRLLKIYERAAKRTAAKAAASQRPKSSYHHGARRAALDFDSEEEEHRDDEGGKKLEPISSYERNKLNNLRSNIALPTCSSVTSSVVGTATAAAAAAKTVTNNGIKASAEVQTETESEPDKFPQPPGSPRKKIVSSSSTVTKPKVQI